MSRRWQVQGRDIGIEESVIRNGEPTGGEIFEWIEEDY